MHIIDIDRCSIDDADTRVAGVAKVAMLWGKKSKIEAHLNQSCCYKDIYTKIYDAYNIYRNKIKDGTLKTPNKYVDLTAFTNGVIDTLHEISGITLTVRVSPAILKTNLYMAIEVATGGVLESQIKPEGIPDANQISNNAEESKDGDKKSIDLDTIAKTAEIVYIWGRKDKVYCGSWDLYDYYGNVYSVVYNAWNTLPSILEGMGEKTGLHIVGYVSEFALEVVDELNKLIKSDGIAASTAQIKKGLDVEPDVMTTYLNKAIQNIINNYKS